MIICQDCAKAAEKLGLGPSSAVLSSHVIARGEEGRVMYLMHSHYSISDAVYLGDTSVSLNRTLGAWCTYICLLCKASAIS